MSICPVTSFFSFFRNSDEKSGGGIGVYVKDCTNYKVRNDIVSINETLDHLWIEVQGKNKRSPYLIRLTWFASNLVLEMLKKSYGLKKINAVPSSIKNARGSSIILTGDTNIDLSSTASYMQEQILDPYKLFCHVIEPTHKG